MFDWLLKIKEYQFLQVNMKFPVSPIYIWSEIFMFYVFHKNRAGGLKPT